MSYTSSQVTIVPRRDVNLLEYLLAYTHVRIARRLGEQYTELNAIWMLSSLDLNDIAEQVVLETVRYGRRMGRSISVGDFIGGVLRANAKISADDYVGVITRVLEKHCGYSVARKIAHIRIHDVDKLKQCEEKLESQIKMLIKKS